MLTNTWPVATSSNSASSACAALGSHTRCALPFFVPGQPLLNPQFDPDNPGKYPYINPAAFRRPANMEYGNTPRRISQLREPALLSEDFSLLKNINLGSEKRYLEFRVAAFDVFNRHRLSGFSFNGITTNFDSPTFGMITNPQAGIGPREIQFGLKFYF